MLALERDRTVAFRAAPAQRPHVRLAKVERVRSARKAHERRVLDFEIHSRVHKVKVIEGDDLNAASRAVREFYH